MWYMLKAFTVMILVTWMAATGIFVTELVLDAARDGRAPEYWPLAYLALSMSPLVGAMGWAFGTGIGQLVGRLKGGE